MMDVYENTREDMVKNKRRFRNSRSPNTDEGAAVPGGTEFRPVFIGFGLLCIVQASLNVCLRLSLYTCDNVTAERDELQKMYSFLQINHQSISEERDELKQKLHELRNDNLTNSSPKEEWIFFSGAFYHGPTSMLSWRMSRLYCQQRGADLIIISSRKEQEFARNFKGRRWIGVSDQESEGVWKWVDGSRLNTSFWYPQEPNDQNGDEDCGEMNFQNVSNNWNDTPCRATKLFICEKKTF